jgi:tetratricopeptide (TPR) repeat protein
MERYADDPRVPKARFLLAESFRKSGLAVRAQAGEAASAGQIQRLAAEATERLLAARELYRRLIDEFEFRDPASLSGRDATLLRLAYLYEADCYFQAQEYRRALQLYEEAANKYKDTVHALASHVQIINSNVFLGQPEEARAVLARALVLVDAIPDAAFDRTLSSETREDWKRYFQWLGRSELF